MNRYLSEEVPDGHELLDGRLVEMPHIGFAAALTIGNLFSALHQHLEARKCGYAFLSGATYHCFREQPLTIRNPSLSVLLVDRDAFMLPEIHCEQAPSLVVVPRSEWVPKEYADRKVIDFIKAGSRVWELLIPERQALIHYSWQSSRVISEHEDLAGEDVLPGFAIPLAAMLPPI